MQIAGRGRASKYSFEALLLTICELRKRKRMKRMRRKKRMMRRMKRMKRVQLVIRGKHSYVPN